MDEATNKHSPDGSLEITRTVGSAQDFGTYQSERKDVRANEQSS